MCSPSLVVAKLAMPTSMPAWRPAAGSGLVGTSSQDSTSVQPSLAFDLDRLHPPRNRAVQVHLDLADAL
jgi:hypothetical protein